MVEQNAEDKTTPSRIESEDTSGLAEGLNDSALLLAMLKAVAVFGILYWCYQSYLIDSEWFELAIENSASCASQLLHLFGEESYIIHSTSTLEDQIYAEDGGAWLVVTAESMAVEFYILLIAGFFALPGSFSKKFLGVVGGILLVFALNTARIAMILVIDIYWPLFFDLARHWIMPFTFSICILLYIIAWLKFSGTKLGAE